ncbi:MAG: O-acetyl-ADP-ribose deacetylase [Candidatus Marinimicrobia bacterium]|nr:O-acetyl-ADP-ribose deacetylase [Candidatus Neomarinimicrobiota bacterium]
MATQIFLIQGDIIAQDTDVIVNAANITLLGGGGVDGAIHKAAGPGLLQECSMIGGCATGEAVITKGYNLKAKRVIHTVGPIWRGGYGDEAESLASCYRNALRLAVSNGLKTISLPALSVGQYGFPIDQATPIAVATVMEFLADDPPVSEIRFVCFTLNIATVYEQELQRRGIQYTKK